MNHIGHHRALAFMLLCLLVAAVLRLPDRTGFPPGLRFDEEANGTLAAEIARLEKRPIFIPNYTGTETPSFYLAG